MINIADLKGAELDKAVARLCHIGGCIIGEDFGGRMSSSFYKDGKVKWSPSTDWTIAGQLIDGWRIELLPDDPWGFDSEWSARVGGHEQMRGKTALIAAMRAFVQSRAGELGASI